MRTFLIFVAFFLTGCHSRSDETPEETDLADKARIRAEEYLWNERDPVTGFWPRKEASIAILGLAAERAAISGVFGHSKINETKIIRQNMERVHADFFVAVSKAGGIAGLNDNTLAELVSVLRLTCEMDPTNYFGHDLIAELNRRVLKEVFERRDIDVWTNEPPLTVPLMVMVLCNNKNMDLAGNHTFDFFKLLSIPTFDLESDPIEDYPLGVERASLNAMAVRCIQGHYAHLDAKSDTKRILYNMAVRNLRYIYRKQHEDGGFGTVYSTTLAIHADLSRLGIPKSLQPFRFAEARKWLINTQQKDGSFGSSITFTSLAIGGLTSRSVDHVSKIKCEEGWTRTHNEFVINFEITDDIFAQNTFVARLPAKKGQTLMRVLLDYAKEHPKTFFFETAKTITGTAITSINGLKTHEGLHYNWFMYKEFRGVTSPMVNLENEIVTEGYLYTFIYK